MRIDQLSDFFLHINIKDHQNLSHRRGRRPYHLSSSESQWSVEKLGSPDVPQTVHYPDSTWGTVHDKSPSSVNKTMKKHGSVSLEKFLRVQVSGICWDTPSKAKDKFPAIKKEARPSFEFWRQYILIWVCCSHLLSNWQLGETGSKRRSATGPDCTANYSTTQEFEPANVMVPKSVQTEMLCGPLAPACHWAQIKA